VNLLILEPNYSFLEQDVAHYIANGKVYAFIFNVGFVIYLHRCQKIYIHHVIKNYPYQSDDYDLASNIKTLYSEQARKRENRALSTDEISYQARYIAFIKQFLIHHAIDCVLMHNDLRWQHALTIKICQQLQIRYLVTEFGIFRPSTITVDKQGVNAYNSLSTESDFYRNCKIQSFEFKDYSQSIWQKIKINSLFGCFLLINRIGDFLRFNVRLKNKEYQWLNYLKLLLPTHSRCQICSDIPLHYFFIPLQVNTDTQVLVHSDFIDMQEFIDCVETAYQQLPPEIQQQYRLVFKIHPMEQGIYHYRFHKNSLINQSDSQQLIAKARLVITINSTVGFEALLQHKSVLVLGNAFYKISGITVSSTQANLVNAILATINEDTAIDVRLIEQFIAYLKYEYQINGNVYYYDKHTLQQIKNNCMNGAK